MRKRIKYSQNFLKSRQLIRNLLEKTTIGVDDLVYEIGAGEGIITKELLDICIEVVAFELDKRLYDKLNQQFGKNQSLSLKHGDFLSYPLPRGQYKVFSNIPFNITSAIVKKLTLTNNPPSDAYLIMQQSAAAKFMVHENRKNSQLAVLLSPFFDFSTFHRFNRNDFVPTPNVDIIMLRILRRSHPLINHKNRELYQDFIVYAFNQTKPSILEGLSEVVDKPTMLKLSQKLGFNPRSVPSQLSARHWINIFQHTLQQGEQRAINLTKGSYSTQLKQQGKIEKIHRTREDKDWKTKG
jgi:23S rRNA (adenine-N6)-dimethyltransferase